ncbi:MAG: hypothetical protein K9N49_01755 [Candidatus Marinimicrobia bacterium]|nr:hypothetical protein [Candidatus Neomarinimicrobiota bacterium]
MTGLDQLFCEQTDDRSIWHGFPNGRHGLGRIAPRAPAAAGSLAGGVDTSAEGLRDDFDRSRPPALTLASGALVIFEALQGWLEGDGIGCADWQRVRWDWHPHYVAGQWRAGELELELAACLTGGDHALIRWVARNRRARPFKGRMVLAGAAAQSNISLHNQRCGLTHERWRNTVACTARADCVIVSVCAARCLWFDLVQDRLLPPDDFDRAQRRVPIGALLRFDPGAGWQVEAAAEAWRATRPLRLRAGEEREFLVRFKGCALGAQPPQAADFEAVATHDDPEPEWAEALAAGEQRWRSLLARVPAPPASLPTAWRRHYYKAWTVPFYNLLPPTDLGHVALKQPTVMCNRVAESGFTVPASWEAALGALLVGLSEPNLGLSVLEGIYATMEDDGFIAEMIGGTRHTQLANVEPIIVELLANRGAEPEALQRLYPRMWRNHLYRHYHANWRHLTPLFCRNLIYNYHAGRSLERLAARLDRPAAERDRLARMADDCELAVAAAWDTENGYYRDEYDAAARAFSAKTQSDTLIALAGAARPAHRARLLAELPARYLADNGAIRAYPVGLPGRAPNAKLARTILKCSNYLLLMPALRSLAPDLFPRIHDGTLTTLAADGDFWEQNDLNGSGFNNGPGGIFGAFGFIWTVLSAEGTTAEWLGEALSVPPARRAKE